MRNESILDVPPSLRAIESARLDTLTRADRMRAEADRLGLELVFDGIRSSRTYGELVGVRRKAAPPAPGSARGDTRYG